jgi:hypothetical protein
MNASVARTYLLFAGLLAALHVASARATLPSHAWSLGAGSELDNEEGVDVAVDAARNVIVAGCYRGTIDLGGGPITCAGERDIFIAKFSATGLHQWSHGFGDTGDDIVAGVAVDASGDVAFTGYFSGTVDFGGTPLVSVGGVDIVVAKLSANGVHLWSRGFGGSSGDTGLGVAADGFGNVVAAGLFEGTVDFGGGPLVGAGSGDMFLAKFSAAGTHIWSQAFGDSVSSDSAWDIAVDGSDNVVMLGSYLGTVDLGGAPLVSAGLYDICLAKFEAAGAHLWSQHFGGNDYDIGNSVAIDASGNVVMVGDFTGTVSFGGPPHTTSDGYGMFIAAYDSDGGYLWSRAHGGFGDRAYGVAITPSQAVVVTGAFSGTVNFGSESLTSSNGIDGFAASYANSGAPLWSFQFAGSAREEGTSVAVDALGGLILTGLYTGSVDFGGGALTSAGLRDAFLVKYESSPHSARISSIADIGNDQGGSVRITLQPSDYDVASSLHRILQYEAYRRIDPLPSATPGAGRSAASPPPAWELAASIPAHGESVYSIVAPTLADSTITGGMHYSVFFIRATTPNSFVYFDSPVDSGYSLDNLSPPPPANLAYGQGVLSWSASRAADFAYFSVYGSASGVLDASAVLLAQTARTDADVSGMSHAYFFVTATDRAGNEGAAARLSFSNGAETRALYALAINAYPNPFNPATTIRYDVPAPGRVAVRVYDAKGARMATLLDREREPGSYVVRWDGRDDGGHRLSSGVYFATVEHASQSETRKIVLLK